MVRRHGWQLPAHTFQILAITVFFILATAFYVFFAPFLWIGALETAAFALYSPLFATVLVLYIRCSGIDPADPSVLKNRPLSKHDENSSFSQISGDMSSVTSSPLSALQSEREHRRKASHAEQGRVGWHKAPGLCSFAGLYMLCCGWVVKEDICFNEEKYEHPVPEEDILFCTLCNAEVRKYSKHCRSCDKCVDGFDHHCRWLNNCVGRKNYSTFIALMATSLLLLVIEWGIGAAVFIRCFVDRKGTLDQIYDKLGNGFSMIPFAAVVLMCTLIAFLASIPLGELFFFHLILMRKGISTYEYVVAMRAQAEAQAESITRAEEDSYLSSPGASTTTGISGASSIGIQIRGGGSWCTPPRIFVEHQDEDPDMVPSRLPSTVDPDAPGRPRKKPSGNVRISAWRLAKLNAQEASLAAAKARDKSSVLQRLGDRNLGNVPETDYSSSSMSSRSALSLDYPLKKSMQRVPQKLATPRGLSSFNLELSRNLPPRTTAPTLRASLERPNLAYVESDVRSSISSHSVTSTLPDSAAMSPLPAESRYGSLEKIQVLPTASPGNSSAENCPSSGPRSSLPTFQGGRSHLSPWGVGETREPSTHGAGQTVVSASRERNIYLRDQRRSAVFWSRSELGRFGGDMSGIGIRPQSRPGMYGGSGISTSTFPSQVLRTWPMNPLAGSDVSVSSESGAASGANFSATASATPTAPALPHPSPTPPSQTQNPPESFSIFFGPPIVPVGNGKAPKN
ncbi:protein S-acyltransferase 21 [Physcomitrium patens]|uniref:S-acyltransferase n=1 Tax=Physcomitrium patens TaxID=3218 RepID=A0A2K1JRX3_PHYPA|nr:protein S-acyltransferase 21-like [Physcomitrium patens]XP_024390060.1 protein S-acyltransferase 21-like [Physcomitrium patens]XP_024390061.1 protein S-acyltransferase 21-like [Physcomitrium patens]XP_024390062.1 protein S-acyltransferase 21-like [Physcomitrium patens]XP_024390063.1 protein S-acyltransferase 21-like [Physcomitrium patens]PNR44283.1 hypothetical protein PHYPA_016667 [Physcomitrium patens]|eukprot:XP_024390059.1 protein S-acyltransferase 21-like [Physcomitrella patens]